MCRPGLSTLLRLEGGVVNDLLPAEGGMAIVDGEVVVIIVVDFGVIFSVAMVLTGAEGMTLADGVSTVVTVVSGTLGTY